MNDNTAMKRAQTNMIRFGVENPFSSKQVQEKIRQTNLEKYGFDHPMKCEEIRSKQAASASSGMSGVEKKFDELTPLNVVFMGYGGRVIHSKRAVHKCGKIMTDLCPDFMVFADSQYPEAQAASDIRVPIKGMSSRFVIEVFGDYYHSESVIGIPTTIHEQEVRDAYASSGIECLILWERDILENWDEIKTSVLEWIQKAVQFMNDGRLGLPISMDENVLRSLADAAYWRTLDESKKKDVVDALVLIYQKIDFPYPDEYDCKEDFRKFCLWASKAGESTRPTRFGMDCCRRFIRSMPKAHVKGFRSLYDMWHDGDRMRRCIEWQLSNESGRHTAKRFLDAMCFKVGFRVVSNLHPSKVVQWVRKYFNPESGGIFFDPCAGWGSRMLAAHSLGMKYIGIDANAQLVKELTDMAQGLGIDAEIHHGDSSNPDTMNTVMAGRKADVVFTSPPYFDKEIYSDDKEQSIIMYPDRALWENEFCRVFVLNAISHLSERGMVVLNMDIEFNMCCLYSQGWDVKEIDVLMENSQRQHTERLIFISAGKIGDILNETDSYIVCRHCGRKCQKLTEHIRRSHGMTKEQYELRYPDFPTMSQRAKECGADANLGKDRGTYTKHVAYRCPDGRVVRKRDVWVRAWGVDTPPADSVVDAGQYDPWVGKIEGEDFVVCVVCGYKASNLLRHVKREHGLEGYVGPLKSKKCEENMSMAVKASWDVRGRKPERDASLNKTHKDHGLTAESLRDLYMGQGLSDAKIGVIYGMTGEGIAYQRKKFGIAARMRTAVIPAIIS